MKRIAVLGSTGTIGTYTLDLVRAFPDRFQVVSLSAGQNAAKLREQIAEFRPQVANIQSDRAASELAAEFPDTEVIPGNTGLQRCIDREDVDIVIVGIVGFSGLAPTLLAIDKQKTVALANKESLVVAGSLLQKRVQLSQAKVIPVDSEHNAIFQLLEGRSRADIDSIVLTASGGPLLNQPERDLRDVTPAEATAHPRWKMGPKISVDSATLMNKGLELIEAHFLFQVPETKLEVWIHPQSIVHGAVWLKDNSCLAQLSVPDMKSSIGYALSYPERLPEPIRKLDFKDLARLEFREPDMERFPCLKLARQALREGQSQVIALNAANEVAVDAFISGRILFPQIAELVERTLNRFSPRPIAELAHVFLANEEAGRTAQELIGRVTAR